MIIKIERYFNYPDLKRQTPDNSMKWDSLLFTEDAIDECDYLVILDYPRKVFLLKSIEIILYISVWNHLMRFLNTDNMQIKM